MFKAHGTYAHLIQVKWSQGLRGKGKKKKKKESLFKVIFPPPPKKK